MKRVLFAGLFHETHTFLDGLTLLSDCEVRRGPELLDGEACGSAMAGAVLVAREAGWTIEPSIYVRAMPGSTVADEVVELFWRELAGAVHTGLDGVCLVLHGAMVSESVDDVEGEVLSRLRAVAACPIAGVLDLHANFTARMAENADALVAYRENPHTDAREAAQRAARLLDRLMRTGEKPVTVWNHPPILWPPTGTSTAEEPCLSLEAHARDIERRHEDILAVNVLPGFAFADVPDAGLSFSAVTVGDPSVAAGELRLLSELAERNKGLGNVIGIPPGEAIRRLGEHSEGPVILAEASDNIGAGAPGDCTGMLRALVEHDVQGAAVVINDPFTVERAATFRSGATFRLSVGGRGSSLDAGPIRLNVELVSTSDGRFTLEDPQSHLASMVGQSVEMGPCAVVRHRGVTILLTTNRTPPFDLGQLRSQGIVPASMRAIVVKAAVAHRRAYDPIAKANYWVETPGPCASDLRTLPYRKVRRPVYPLDG